LHFNLLSGFILFALVVVFLKHRVDMYFVI
jgi:hypothetical protein